MSTSAIERRISRVTSHVQRTTSLADANTLVSDEATKALLVELAQQPMARLEPGKKPGACDLYDQALICCINVANAVLTDPACVENIKRVGVTAFIDRLIHADQALTRSLKKLNSVLAGTSDHMPFEIDHGSLDGVLLRPGKFGVPEPVPVRVLSFAKDPLTASLEIGDEIVKYSRDLGDLYMPEKSPLEASIAGNCRNMRSNEPLFAGMRLVSFDARNGEMTRATVAQDEVPESFGSAMYWVTRDDGLTVQWNRNLSSRVYVDSDETFSC